MSCSKEKDIFFYIVNRTDSQIDSLSFGDQNYNLGTQYIFTLKAHETIQKNFGENLGITIYNLVTKDTIIRKGSIDRRIKPDIV